MEIEVIKLHSSELIGTCDKTDFCGTMNTQVQALEAMGMDSEAVEIFIEHRREVCATVGKCSLYYGVVEDDK